MNTLLGLGKALTALFWGVVLANLLSPFAQPFALLLHVAGALILLIHGLELLLFNARLSERGQPARERVQVMLFGIFHLLGLPQPQAQSLSVAPLEVEHA